MHEYGFEIHIFSRQHFNAIRAQSVACALARFSFRRRLRKIFRFHVVRERSCAGHGTKPIPLISKKKLGILQPYETIGSQQATNQLLSEHTTLSELTHRVMGTAVEDDDDGALNVLQRFCCNGFRQPAQPNLCTSYGNKTTRSCTHRGKRFNPKVIKLGKKALTRHLRRSWSSTVVSLMYAEACSLNAGHRYSRNPLKALRCAVMPEVIFADFEQAAVYYRKAKEL